jgi:hypothetical protein
MEDERLPQRVSAGERTQRRRPSVSHEPEPRHPQGPGHE